VSRAELLEQVWGLRGDLHTRSVDMAVAVLRKKVERQAERPELILSIKGVGYGWGGPA
jgi:two-component system response regulator MtrA